MKNRKSMIVAFLLCACLIVGVGYAAIADQLTIDGTVEYAPSSTNLDGNVYYTGHMFFVNGDHQTVDTEALIVDVVGGSQAATITAQYTYDTIQQFHKDSAYVSGVVLEVAIENTSETDELTVAFGDIAMSGTVGTQSPFEVVTTLKTTADGTGADVTENITVGVGETTHVYVHVRISLQEQVVSENQTVEATDFAVILPVTKVEA